MKTSTIACILWAIATGILCAQPVPQHQKNITLTGHLPYPERLSDVWGYVDSAGTEYALVGSLTGTSVVNLSDPSQPFQQHWIPGPATIWRDIKVYKHYAYISSESLEGLVIANLRYLPDSIDYKILNVGNIHNIWIDTVKGQLFTSGAVQNQGMDIFDLEPDPWNPVLAGRYDDRYVHDVYVRGNFAYSAEIFDGFLTILDISDPDSIEILATQTYTNAFTHNTWLNDAGNICFTTDELGGDYLHAWDVSDPENIVLMDRFRPVYPNIPAPTLHNAHILNDYMILSTYADGIRIIDVSRPQKMQTVGYYDTSLGNGPGIVGCWGAYPFLPSGIVLASDIETGLYILQPDYKRPWLLEGEIRDAVSNSPLSQVEISFQAYQVPDSSDISGKYQVGSVETGDYTFHFGKTGYESEQRTYSFGYGDYQLENLNLTPRRATHLSMIVADEETRLPVGNARVHLSSFNDQYDYVTDSEGKVSDSTIFSELFEIVVGKWGYEQVVITQKIDPSTQLDTIFLKAGYYDDFALDHNWIAQQSATQGNWVRDIPKASTFIGGRPLNPDRDSEDDTGNFAYVTGNQGTEAQDDDVAGGKTILISPLMNLGAYQDPVIYFDYWMVNKKPNGQLGDDTLRVFMISDGIQYEVLKISGDSSAWLETGFRILDFTNPGQSVFLRFEIEDSGSEDILEAGIDKFQVVETAPSVGIKDDLAVVSFEAFPNPFKDHLILNYAFKSPSEREAVFELLDLQGRVVFSHRINPDSDNVVVHPSVPAGIYIGRIASDGSIMQTLKLIKM